MAQSAGGISIYIFPCYSGSLIILERNPLAVLLRILEDACNFRKKNYLDIKLDFLFF